MAKKQMKVVLLGMILVCAFCGGTAFADTAGVYGNAENKAESLIATLMESGDATSVQYALIDNSQIAISGNAGVYSIYARNLFYSPWLGEH